MSTILSDFDYELPESLIAQHPVEPRDKCRLLVLDRATAMTQHTVFDQIGRWLTPNDLLVLNDTKVLRARLHAYDDSDRKFEVMLLGQLEDDISWECLVRPAKKLVKAGCRLNFQSGATGTFRRKDDFLWEVRFEGIQKGGMFDWLELHGELPLPPYISRTVEKPDFDRYQTVFAGVPGSVAAPTAGLHFTQGLVDALKGQGVGIERVTLHVGYGTFSPIREENLDVHRMHHETYSIAQATWDRVAETKARGGRVIACGTTVVRALESVATHGLSASTDIFIRPGYRFQVVDALITNFHLPKSSLLVLVSAFAGRERILETYASARSEGYRFFSYGDAMLLL